MFSFAIRMIRDKYKTFLAFIGGTLVFLEMYIALFPFIQKQSASFDAMIKSMPVEFFNALNMDSASFSFASLEPYLATEYMSFLWPILAIVLAVIMANYIIMNDIDRGTVETLSSLPANRTRIFLERYFTGFFMIVVFSVVSMLLAPLLASIHGINFVFNNYLVASFGSFLFCWAVYSMSVFTSMFFKEKGKSNMVIGGTLTFMYVLSIVSSLNSNLESLKYLSIFNYFNGTDLITRGVLPEYSLIVFVSLSVIMSVFALYRFKKRDLAV